MQAYKEWPKEISDNLKNPGAKSSNQHNPDCMERAADNYFGIFLIIFFINFSYFLLIILIYKGEKIYQNEEEKMNVVNVANRFKCNNLLARQQCFYKSFFQKYHILSRYNIYHHASHYRVIYFLFIIFILD